MKEKILGEDRRSLLLNWLKESKEPLTGSRLAKKTNVSRQVIVQDISLLKARNEPIIATAQGYVYFQANKNAQRCSRVIACQHLGSETEDELNTIVNFGVSIKDVTIEHPLYGDLTGSLMINNRHDVAQFIKNIQEKSASYLLELTEGVHLHTLEAETDQQLEQTCQALFEKGYLLSSER
ncbi:transcription repressor NadR [Pseudalkalibacillus decolorationis]|uniref:transcription repressor NadR n=1 Tax=Pseudalkalibacillus decolorationis TaxID=163879 RepID=UPI0021495BCF|nr:transcription repressor NadR [Pseudalkalibacillus decolorationis]